jgi:Dyp-type peroxidase family
MGIAKYFKTILAFEAAETQGLADAENFDTSPYIKSGWLAEVRRWAVSQGLVSVLSLSSRFAPAIDLQGLKWLLRPEQVIAALAASDDLQVPFGREMKSLAGGHDFVLGITNPVDHQRQNLIIRNALGKAASPQILRDLARHYGRGLIANSNGRIDVMRDFIVRASTEVCLRYFGLRPSDAYGFADQCLAVSNLLFADPFGNPESRSLAMEGASRLRRLIDEATFQSRRNPDLWEHNPDDRFGRPVIDILVHEMGLDGKAGSKLPDAEIRAIVIGLVTGFVPTISLALANVWLEFQARPEVEETARRAANEAISNSSWDNLDAIILELARLRPALSPGQLRYCVKDTNIAGVSIAAGTTVMVATACALRDPTLFPDPNAFRLDRSTPSGAVHNSSLIFGSGIHFCLGAKLAQAVMGGLFAELLSLQNLRRAKGKDSSLEFLFGFPYRMDMTFDTSETGARMCLIIVPIMRHIDDEVVEMQIGVLGHPATDAIKAALDKTNVVHFMSLALLKDGADRYLSFELSVDGDLNQAIDALTNALGKPLEDLLDTVAPESRGARAAFLKARVVTLASSLFGNTGLDFNGLPGISVARKAREQALAEASQGLIDDYLQHSIGDGQRPAHILNLVRYGIKHDRNAHLTPERTRRIEALEQVEREGLDATTLVPSRQRLGLSTFRKVARLAGVWKILRSPDAWPITVPLGVVFAVAMTGFWRLLDVLAWLGSGFWASSNWVPLASGIGLSIIGALAVTGSIAAILALVFWVVLRHREKTDPISSSAASSAHMERLLRSENHAGYIQSHILAVGDLKPGWFRVFTHVLGLWGIKQVVANYFRPGFVLNMGTIHYARWWRLPGTRKVAFYSNYDGSWESYLEDFIARARWGQTAAWSNWQGFPKTRGLVFEGAADGDRFKRWVRTQQQATGFWYSRFPKLSAENIRRNNLIQDGFEHAQTDDEAADWLRLFGAQPRTSNTIESANVQSLVFSGQGRLPYVHYLFVSLPAQAQDLQAWLSLLLGQWVELGAEKVDRLVRLAGVECRQNRCRLQTSFAISFGDRSPSVTARAEAGGGQQSLRSVFLALTAAGFEAAAASKGNSDNALRDVLDSFPHPFKAGMASRAAILGDYHESDPGNWRWVDGPNSPVHAGLMLYGDTETGLSDLTATHLALLEVLGGNLVSEQVSALVDGRIDIEPFGFKDGISQPVMRGTRKFATGAWSGDIVEPGEFLFGYRNSIDHFPVSPTAPSTADSHDDLPALDPAALSRYPDFQARDLNDRLRDFGRNGTFLVVRQLAQDVDGFRAFTEQQARLLAGLEAADPNQTAHYHGLDRAVSNAVDAEWVAAKMVGRWRDGRPLVQFPTLTDQVSYRGKDLNAFDYGTQDPIGLSCPFGAHIRRANPRDSKEPGDPRELNITNRHRIIRRGRAYWQSEATGTAETGLMFLAFCTDLERQFEFIQQTWLNAPAFHGLQDEVDPLIGTGAGSNNFTIPTPSGPIKLQNLSTHVTTKAGGYFFLPGLAAFRFLTAQLG